MKSSISLVKAIITTNFIIAGCSVVFLSLSRSRQLYSLVEVQPNEEEFYYHRKVKVQIPDEQRQLQQQQEQIQQQDQKIQSLYAQLAEYQQSILSLPNPPVVTSELLPKDLLPKNLLSDAASLPEVMLTDVSSSNSSSLNESFFYALKEKHQSSQAHIPKPSPHPTREQQQPTVPTVNYINDISVGLVVAQNLGLLRHNSQEYKRYQNVIRLLKQGESLEKAAHKAHIPLVDLYQVLAWGENRPGNPHKYHPPLLSIQNSSSRSVDEPIHYANDIAVGLLVAARKGQIHYGTAQYKRVQTAIKLLRQGNTLQQAAYQSNVSLYTLEQLIKWGEVRPGSDQHFVSVKDK